MKTKCVECDEEAVYLESNEWTVYTLKNGMIQDSGSVISVEDQIYYCDKHYHVKSD